MKNKLILILLGATLLLMGAFTACTKSEVPPIRKGDPDIIANPNNPRPIYQAPEESTLLPEE